MTLPRRLGVLAATLVLLGLTACSGAPDDDLPGAPEVDVAAPRSGGTLPDVTLEAFDDDGELDLGELRGPAVVNLWASWCGPCKRELPFYQQVSEELAGRVEVIGIDFQETRLEKARTMLSDAGVTYPVYADPDGALRAAALPKVVLVDAEGRIAFEQYLEIEDAEQLSRLVREHLDVEGG